MRIYLYIISEKIPGKMGLKKKQTEKSKQHKAIL